MKKFLISFLVMIMIALICVPSLTVFANTQHQIHLPITQPYPTNSTKYFIIYTANGDARIYEFTCFIPENWTFEVYWSTYNNNGNPYWAYYADIYDENGQIVTGMAYNVWLYIQTGSLAYNQIKQTGTTVNTNNPCSAYSYYFHYGTQFIVAQASVYTDMYFLGDILFADTIDYSSDFATINSHLVYLNEYIFQILDVNIDMAADVAAIRNINNQALFALQSIDGTLDKIYELLGGEESTTLDQDHGEDLYDQIEENLSQEDQFMDDFIDEIDQLDDRFDDVNTIINTPSILNGFYLFTNIFNLAFNNFQLFYIPIFLSLVLGLVLTIIGKRIL